MKSKTKPPTPGVAAAQVAKVKAERAADIDRLNRMADEALKQFAPPRKETLQ
jgi:hypothetical protein